MNARLAALACAAALASCAGNPQRLPIGLSLCEAVSQPGGFAVNATVENKADRPITSIALSLSFYRDFRYAQYTASAHLRKELDPGEKRSITFDVGARGARQSGQAMRCIVTHIGYMDGTSADLPPSE